MQSYFNQILSLPPNVQMLWRTWRDKQLAITPRETIIQNSHCPLRHCKAIEGYECRSVSGQPAYHESRHNEFFAELFLSKME